MKKNVSVRLTESAIMLAFATVLSLVKIVEMPYGGTVTAASMLPVILIAYRYGTPWGLFTGFTASLLMLVLGLNNLSYATSGTAAFAIIMLDYILAFTAMGLGGIFRKSVKKQSTALALGTIVVCAVRFVCHVISGCTVWAGVSIPDADGLIYSIGYNAVYMVPETIITVAAAVMIGSMLDFSSDAIVPIATGKERGRSRSFGALLLLVAAAVDALFLFSSTQIENADGDVIFSITGLASANWLLICVVTAGALIAFFAPEKLSPIITLATGVVYTAGSLIRSAVSGADFEWVFILGVLAACAVLAVALYRRYVPAVLAAGILTAVVYSLSVLSSGDGFTGYDIVIAVVAVLGGILGAYAVAAYRKKRATA